MVYPLLLASAEQANQVRSALQQQRIYVATYWRELLDDPALGAAARRWTACMLPLPIDQRYDDGDMERVAGAVLQALGRT
jgi:dTDP-4-amino-4,6-dideoxygalactose transaminase